MAKQSLSLSQRQRLALSPVLMIGLSILRLPALDLIEAIEAEAADNPYLIHDDLRAGVTPVAGSVYDVALATMAETSSLVVDLHRQIGAMTLAPNVRAVAEYLAGDLSEQGYLETPLEQLALTLALPPALIEAGLQALQSCDPAGVGARNLAECLQLQLADRGVSSDLAIRVVRHLDLFAIEDWRGLRRALMLERSDLLQLADLIREMKPHPVTPLLAPDTYLLPDLVMEQDRSGATVVSLAMGLSGKVRLNMSLVSAAVASGSDFAADRRRRAEAMMQALTFRGETLLRIGRAIAARQHRFFAFGPDHLVPMSRADLAAELGLHPSTIGRAVSAKAMEVGGQLYPLSFFFSQALPDQTNPGIAAFVVQRRIAQMIEQEAASAPLTDEAICAALRVTGVDIARRTVAKYRGCMRIPSSFARRRRKAVHRLRPGTPGGTRPPHD